MTAHVCPDCSLLHDGPTVPAESEAVALARIAKEQAVEVERIRAGAERAAAAATVEVAHEQARAEVDSAEAQAELLGDAIEASAGSDDAPEPIEVIAPDITEDETEVDELAPPPADDSPAPTAPAKPRGLGFW